MPIQPTPNDVEANSRLLEIGPLSQAEHIALLGLIAMTTVRKGSADWSDIVGHIMTIRSVPTDYLEEFANRYR